MAAAIVAEGLVKTYGGRSKGGGGVRALDGVDLQVEQGTVLGLLGPNGAGKTTMVRILSTLLLPDSGRATVAGIDVVKSPDEVRRVMGLSGQYSAVDENLTGRENLTIFGQLYHLGTRTAKSRANELLDEFRLDEAADRVVKTYSGGMRRRLDLAGALIARPQILFLDEPTTGLDPRSRLGMWEVISSLVSDGATLLLTTQYLEEADQLANKIAVIDRGQIIAAGTSDELKAQLGGERIEVVVHDPAHTQATIDAMKIVQPGNEAVVDQQGRRVRYPVTGGARLLVELVRELDAAGVVIDDIALRRPTLDDVFLTLTGHAAEDSGDAGDAGEGCRSRPVRGHGRHEGQQEGQQEGRQEGREAGPRDIREGLRESECPVSAATLVEPLVAAPREGGGPVTALQDGLVITKRNLLQIPRVPELLVFSTIQPIMFVLLFAYVFGSAIPLPGGGGYKEFLMAGIFTQTVAFSTGTTSIGLADDLQKGLIDRFRSLPMARSAVLVGRTNADLVRNVFIVFIMSICGLVVGWRIEDGFARATAAFAILLLFGYAMSWIGAIIGLSVKSVETANTAGFIWLFPLTFLSNAFVPTGGLPGPLKWIADHNPVSYVASACRELFGNPNPFAIDGAIWKAIAINVLILVLAIPFAVRKYRAAASR